MAECEESEYLRRLLDMWDKGQLAVKPGTVTRVSVFHDDWCSFWQTGRCDCNPEIAVHPASAGKAL